MKNLNMTKKEKRVLNNTTKVWNNFLKLKPAHPDDKHDVRFHIHAIQNIVMARKQTIKEIKYRK